MNKRALFVLTFLLLLVAALSFLQAGLHVLSTPLV